LECLKSTTEETSIDEDVEKKERLCTVGRNANWWSHCGKQYGASSENLKKVMAPLGIYAKKQKTKNKKTNPKH